MTRLDSFNVVATLGDTVHRVAKMAFAKDGSIYVMFPGFGEDEGLVCEYFMAPCIPYPADINLGELGKVAGHLVNYSHHPDGRAHFSQTGKVRTEVRKQSVPLDIQRGHLFTIQLQSPDAFPPPRVEDKTPQLTINLHGNVRGLKIVAYRFHVDDLNPMDTWELRGAPLYVMPPEGFQFDDFVLFLEPQEWTNKIEDPCLIFIGGFDHQKRAFDHHQSTSALVMLYPCSDPAALRGKLGSVDFIPREQPNE